MSLFPIPNPEGKKKGNAPAAGSLFAAYATPATVPAPVAVAAEAPEEDTSWLRLTSFKPPPGAVPEVQARKSALDFFAAWDAQYTGPEPAKAAVEVREVDVQAQDAMEVSSEGEIREERSSRDERSASPRERERSESKSPSESSSAARRRRKRKRKRKSKKTDREKELARERKLVEKGKLQRVSARTAWIDERPVGEVSVYFYDTKGDRDNLAFETLYRTDIARYRRSVLSCMGLAPGTRVHWGEKAVTAEEEARERRRQRYCYSKKVKLLRDPKTKSIRVASRARPRADDPLALNDGFVKLAVAAPADAASDDSDGGRRRFEGETRGEGESMEEYLTRLSQRFNEDTRRSPNDIDLWYRFVEFQNKYMELQNMNEGFVREKRIAIFEKAISKNPQSTELLAGYLKEIQHVWDSDKVLQLWSKVMLKYPHNVALWMDYLSFRQGHFSSFTYTDVHNLYGRCLRELAAYRRAFDMKPAQEADLERSMLRIFLRACRFERAAGQEERAVGAFQALIEFNVLAPLGQDERDWKGKMRAFEAFWESDVPRVGDDGAEGWAAWFKDHEGDGEPTAAELDADAAMWGGWAEAQAGGGPAGPKAMIGPQPAKEAPGIEEDATVVFALWHEKETEREATYCLPYRPVDLNAGRARGDPAFDDPERVVLFEDVMDYLFSIRSQENKIQLVLLFLEFLGAYIPPNHQLATTDPLARDRALDREDVEDVFSFMSSVREVGAINWDLLPTRPLDDVRTPFVRNVLTRCLVAWPQSLPLMETLFYFETRQSPEKGRDAAKQVLKQERFNLQVWHAYAQMEFVSDRVREASKVYETALTMAQQLAPTQRGDLPLVCRAYAEILLETAGDMGPSAALHVLSACVTGTFSPLQEAMQSGTLAKPAPTTVLRVRKLFKDRIDAAVRGPDSVVLAPAFSHTVGCYATFEYLSVGLAAASEVFELALERLSRVEADQRVVEEQLFHAYVKRVYVHQLTFATRPSILRDLLMRALVLFPDNVVFLSLFVVGEARSQIANRVRRYFDAACEGTSSPVPWAFSVRSELARHGAWARVRTVLEKAIATSPSAMLWRLYLQFEVARGQGEAAKRVFFRATARLPGRKSLWMDAISLLRTVLTVKELDDIIEMMQDKELRLRTDVVEIMPEMA